MPSNGLSTGAVIGLTVGSLVDIAIIAFVVIFILRRREKTLRLLASAKGDAEKARLTRSQRLDRQTRRAASTKRKVMEWRDVPGSSGGVSNTSGGGNKNNSNNGLETVTEGRGDGGNGTSGGSGEGGVSSPGSGAVPRPSGLGGRISDFFGSSRKSRLWASPFSSSEDPVELPADDDSTVQRPARMATASSSRSGLLHELPSTMMEGSAASDWPRPLNITPPASRRAMMPAAWQSAKTSPSRKTAAGGSDASASVRPLPSSHGSDEFHRGDNGSDEFYRRDNGNGIGNDEFYRRDNGNGVGNDWSAAAVDEKDLERDMAALYARRG